MRRSVLAAAVVLVLSTGCSVSSGSSKPAATVTVSVTASTSAPPSALSMTSPSASPTFSSTPLPTAGASDLSRPPRTYAQGRAHLRAAAGTAFVKRFVTPSGNIYCNLGDGVIPPSCELGTGAVRDPQACPGAPSQYVGRMEFHGGHAVPICNSDTIRVPGAPTLDYGTIGAKRGGAVRCLVETIGVTCLDSTSQQGFLLRRGQFIVLR